MKQINKDCGCNDRFNDKDFMYAGEDFYLPNIGSCVSGLGVTHRPLRPINPCYTEPYSCNSKQYDKDSALYNVIGQVGELNKQICAIVGSVDKLVNQYIPCITKEIANIKNNEAILNNNQYELNGRIQVLEYNDDIYFDEQTGCLYKSQYITQ